MKNHKVIIFSAPSGSGKSTIIGRLLKQFPTLAFSISATSRAPRGEEVDGKDYYFLSGEAFAEKAKNNEFLEWEEVYQGTCYGTLKSELKRIWGEGGTVIFDVDVKGGINIKKLLGQDALSVFIMPPSVEELRRRLTSRATDSAEAIEKRIAKAELELSYADKFDTIIVNDSLEEAVEEAAKTIQSFLSR